MKLQTSITPRRDGTVKVLGANKIEYLFKPDEHGELTCDVPDDETVALLLSLRTFWPADPADHEAAMALISAPAATDGDDDDNEGPADLAPVEANTPAKPASRKRKAAP